MRVVPVYLAVPLVLALVLIVSQLNCKVSIYGTSSNMQQPIQHGFIPRSFTDRDTYHRQNLQLTVQQALRWAAVSWGNGTGLDVSAAPRPIFDSEERNVTSDKFEKLDGE